MKYFLRDRDDTEITTLNGDHRLRCQCAVRLTHPEVNCSPQANSIPPVLCYHLRVDRGGTSVTHHISAAWIPFHTAFAERAQTQACLSYPKTRRDPQPVTLTLNSLTFYTSFGYSQVRQLHSIFFLRKRNQPFFLSQKKQGDSIQLQLGMWIIKAQFSHGKCL